MSRAITRPYLPAWLSILKIAQEAIAKVERPGPFIRVQVKLGPNDKPYKRYEQLEPVSDMGEPMITSCLWTIR